MSYVSEHLELNTSHDKFMQLSMASTNYSNTYRSPNSTDMCQEAETLRIFELTKSELSNNLNNLGRTQDKPGFKKIGKRPLYQYKPKYNPKRTNNLQSNLQSNKNQNNQPKSNLKKDLSMQELQTKYVELDEQLKRLKMRQRRTTNNLSKSTKRDNEYLSKALLTIQNYAKKNKNQGVEMKQCKQGIAQQYIQCQSVKSNCRSSIGEKTQKQSHFFNKLKKKMNEELEKIKEKKENTQPREIVQGCKLKKNIHNNSRDAFRTPLTDRNKSKTAITRSGLQTTSRDSVKKKRPQSARQRVLQSKELKFKIQKIAEQDNIELRGTKIETKKTQKFSKALSNISYSQPQISKTFRHISPIYKQRNWTTTKKEVEHQKIKEKMLTILIDCQGESQKKDTIEEGIKVFESYSKKMGKTLGKKSKLLTNIQKTQMFDNEADEEYH